MDLVKTVLNLGVGSECPVQDGASASRSFLDRLHREASSAVLSGRRSYNDVLGLMSIWMRLRRMEPTGAFRHHVGDDVTNTLGEVFAQLDGIVSPNLADLARQFVHADVSGGVMAQSAYAFIDLDRECATQSRFRISDPFAYTDSLVLRSMGLFDILDTVFCFRDLCSEREEALPVLEDPLTSYFWAMVDDFETWCFKPHPQEDGDGISLLHALIPRTCLYQWCWAQHLDIYRLERYPTSAEMHAEINRLSMADRLLSAAKTPRR